MGAADVEQLRSRAGVVRRLLVEPDVVVVAIRRLADVPDRVIESLRVRAPGRLPRLGTERACQVEIAATVQWVDDDVVAALVCDTGAVGRPGRAVVGHAGGVRDVPGGRARRGEIEDVDVVTGHTARTLGEGNLRAIRRPGRVAVLLCQSRGERAGGEPGTCAARDAAQEELGVAERGPLDKDNSAVRTREHRAGRRRKNQQSHERDSDGDWPEQVRRAPRAPRYADASRLAPKTLHDQDRQDPISTLATLASTGVGRNGVRTPSRAGSRPSTPPTQSQTRPRAALTAPWTRCGSWERSSVRWRRS
jgi:hypothetical protein